MNKKMRRKFIIDTDIGLDDAGAVLLAAAAHKEKKIEIIAITAVHGNTSLDNVVLNTARTLHAANLNDIPVYRGAHSSLVEPFQHTRPFHGWDGFGDASHDSEPDTSCVKSGEHAVNAMVRLAGQHRGEVTLVTLGPLTNVAMAIRMDPNFAANLREIYIMGGNTEGVGNITVSAEFNFHCDPEAAFIVLQNVKCPTFITAWELCLRRARISWDWRRKVLGRLESPEASLINRIEAGIMVNPRFGSWVVCDQLAMAAALDPRIMRKTSRHYAMVELAGRFTRGQMVVDYGLKMQKEPNVFIVDDVHLELFQSMLLWALGDKTSPYQLPEDA